MAHLLLAATAQASPKPKAKEPLLQRFIPLHSKIEHGHRKATREQVQQLAKYFKADEDELIVAWLSDKLAHELQDEDLSKQALKAAEKRFIS